ncbi:hypothetical protein F0562_006380 [Nyssa sinensis]|uniref:Uncharacterized protein n=1 Tax=Nyssa sinensis TaxID=561372 RepID=A0A5J5ALN9_9ASTE|nr:hypothetical protein F0562_006380 [Nyssa sinensis]
MFRALSTRRSGRGYDRLADEPSGGVLQAKLKRTTSVPAEVPFGSSSKKLTAESNFAANSSVKQPKTASKIHPIFGLFDSRRRKKATAKPEIARYLEYVKEGGLANPRVPTTIFLLILREMLTYTAITLDSLLEPGVSKSMAGAKEAPDSKLGRRNSTPISKLESGMNAPNSKLERRNNTSTATEIDKKHHWARISPALYATPEPTPLPDSPSSFPPSPYIINHKRRGPRLLKSFSEDDVATRRQALDEEKVVENAEKAEEEVADLAKDVTSTVTAPSPIEEHTNGIYDGGLGSGGLSNGQVEQNSSAKSVTFNLERESEADDFFDPQELLSVKSNTEGESNSGVERSLNFTTPMAEFFDAWEELSPESGPQPSLCDVEAELREIRLSILMEIEKRKQAEEALNNMQSKWRRIRQQLSLVGLILPADLISVSEDEQVDIDLVEELCQQIYLARFVSNSIGRGIAKAEVEMEMEAQMELKNFEITRLWDRLQYYEAVNREMSQRNQEAVEMARRLRQRRKRRQWWVWGSIAAVVTIGSAALAWLVCGVHCHCLGDCPPVKHGNSENKLTGYDYVSRGDGFPITVGFESIGRAYNHQCVFQVRVHSCNSLGCGIGKRSLIN